MLQAEPINPNVKAASKQANDARQSGPEREGLAAAERMRVETVVETLAALRGRGETLSELAHDARNMVTALGLYCDLLEEPGVLASPFMHYGHELRLVAAASRRLVERIVSIDAQSLDRPRFGAQRIVTQTASSFAPTLLLPASKERAKEKSNRPRETAAAADRSAGAFVANSNRRWDLLPAVPISNLAAELLANRNLLAALAGPAIALTVDAEGGARPVRLTGEDLTRILVNLVKNAAEAMPEGGRVSISLREQPARNGTVDCLELTVDDNGPGIPDGALEAVFESGYTTHEMSDISRGSWPLSHRGLGLTISRSIVEAAGGRITVCNRAQGGSRFTIELPLRKGSH